MINKNNINIDTYKYQNLVCTYCKKQYLRYGAYKKHVDSCKYKCIQIERTAFSNSNATSEQPHNDLMQMMKNEIVTLRSEVGELRTLLMTLLNHQLSNKTPNNTIVGNKNETNVSINNKTDGTSKLESVCDDDDDNDDDEASSFQKLSEIKVVDNLSLIHI